MDLECTVSRGLFKKLVGMKCSQLENEAIFKKTVTTSIRTKQKEFSEFVQF